MLLYQSLAVVLIIFNVEKVVMIPNHENSTVLYKENVNPNTTGVIAEEDFLDSKVVNNNKNNTSIPSPNKQNIVSLESHDDGIGIGSEETTTQITEDDIDGKPNINYTFRGPDTSVQKENLENPVQLSPEDVEVRNTWGGNCLSSNWNHCSKIKFWGGPYFVPDKQNPGKFVLMYNEIRCNTENEKYYCLTNGWTVPRCTLMCMQQCNKDFLLKFDRMVKHEGLCATPIG